MCLSVAAAQQWQLTSPLVWCIVLAYCVVIPSGLQNHYGLWAASDDAGKHGALWTFTKSELKQLLSC